MLLIEYSNPSTAARSNKTDFEISTLQDFQCKKYKKYFKSRNLAKITPCTSIHRSPKYSRFPRQPQTLPLPARVNSPPSTPQRGARPPHPRISLRNDRPDEIAPDLLMRSRYFAPLERDVMQNTDESAREREAAAAAAGRRAKFRAQLKHLQPI